MDQPLLQMRGICRSFPGVKALDGVDFTLQAGEIHALMGENGAGKSTLIKVLTGVYPAQAGQILMQGRPIAPRSTRHAQAEGISTVYQEVNLVPTLSVAENIFLGRQPRKLGFVDWKTIRRRSQDALKRLDLDIDVSAPLNSYSIAIQQMVAIARSLDVSAKILILDEPTSSLDTNEVAQLFAVMRKLRSDGLGIIFVSHFLDQVYQVSDRMTVLRNGKLVGQYDAADLPRMELIARMMGKDVAEITAMSAHRAPAPANDNRRVFLSARGLGKKGTIQPMDVDVASGEIMGLAGLLGSGRTETAKMLFGVYHADSGQLTVNGQAVSFRNPSQAIASGLGFCPEDRKGEAIIPDLSIRENIILVLQAQRGWWRPLSRKQQDALADKYIKALRIATPDAEKSIKFLSGGNQQKAILARWMAANPRLLILDEPTRGIDVGAKFEIAQLIESLCGQGMAILFISSELEEVVRSSSRVVVLRDRKKIAELTGGQIDEAGIMAAIAETPAAKTEGAHA